VTGEQKTIGVRKSGGRSGFPPAASHFRLRQARCNAPLTRALGGHRMLATWAARRMRGATRDLIITFGIPLTLALGFLSVLSAYHFFASLNLSNIGLTELLYRGVLGLGGAVGIFAAWVRVCISPERLRASLPLRVSICFGLLSGIAVAGFWVFLSLANTPAIFLVIPFGAPLCIGLFFLAATLGESSDHPTKQS